MVKGDIFTGEVYYTNSTLFNVGAPVNPIERVKLEGRFHPLIEAGAITHVFLGEQRPSKESLANFVIKIFKETKNDQVAFSPEFTCCQKCRAHRPGDIGELLGLRFRPGGPHHPHNRLLHQGLLLEQGQTGRAQGPLPATRAFSPPIPNRRPRPAKGAKGGRANGGYNRSPKYTGGS